MWRVERPAVSVGEIVKLCARGIGDKELAARVLNAREVFEQNSKSMEASVLIDKVHDIASRLTDVTDISNIELKWLYTAQLSGKGRPARRAYADLLNGALGELCSYCQYGLAKNLDHFVPKSAVPLLSIDPWNLIPCCPDCNHTLRDGFSTDPSEQMLHPYALPEIGRWLKARVNHGTPVTLTFFADPDPKLSPLLQKRIENQFKILGLARLFSVVSNQQLTTTSRSLTKRFAGKSKHKVREHLIEQADEARGDEDNVRQSVVFEALADDDWYCSGGFLPLETS